LRVEQDRERERESLFALVQKYPKDLAEKAEPLGESGEIKRDNV